MTIDEAIEILTIFREQESALLGDEFAQATALGIEALKRVKHLRPNEAYANATRLPGEAED